MTWALDTAAACAAFGAVAGLGVPALIARIPEPEPESEPEAIAARPPVAQRVTQRVTQSEAEAEAEAGEPAADPRSRPPTVAAASEPKETYVAVAAARGLAGRAALASGVAAALVGLELGWRWSLLPLLALVPVGVALAVVDWRTRLLPTKVILPTYAVVGLLSVAAAGLADDWPSLVRALEGLVIARGTFWLLWLVYPRGMGFGDVRLAGVLGLALGLLGWGQLALGIYAGFVLGGVGGLLLAAAKVVHRGAYPFGPFMLLGALLGVLGGGALSDYYLGRL